MKTANPHNRKRRRAGKPSRAELKQKQFVQYMKAMAAQREAASKVVSTCFGIVNAGDTPPIDAVLMGRLRSALDQADEQLQEACWQRGLLSRRLAECLHVTRFLSFALPLARAAQASTGVPASILVAEAYMASAGSISVRGYDLFNTGRRYVSYLDSFVDYAYTLRNDPTFEAVMRARGNPANYLRELTRWSNAKHDGDRTVSDNIEEYGLVECDRLRPLI